MKIIDLLESSVLMEMAQLKVKLTEKHSGLLLRILQKIGKKCLTITLGMICYKGNEGVLKNGWL